MSEDTAGSGSLDVRISLLGRFEVVVAGRAVEIGSPKERALLARVALNPGDVVSVDALVEAIWGVGERPEDPARALRYHVWHLRGLLEPERPERSEGSLLLTRQPGYVLAVDGAAVDTVRVERSWRQAQSINHDMVQRRELLAEALASWWPPAFGDPDVGGPLEQGATRLAELRLTAIEDRVAADLDLGGGSELVAELEDLVAMQPFRERLRGQLMVALYRAGRQADALAAYSQGRALLADELGIDPGPELQVLERQVLLQDEHLRGPRQPTHSGPTQRRGNLPTPLDSFVGRDAAVAEIHRFLDEHRIVTLTGVGGTGKTRLAVEAGRRLEARFADGIWLAELASVRDPDLVATAIGEVWGLRPAETAMSEVLLTFLWTRELLLIVDNCEHVAGSSADLIRLLLEHAPGLRVLATSRESLGVPGENVVRVPSLGLESTDGHRSDAARLFADRAAAAHPGSDPTTDERAAIDRICARVDGIPLGVELAAARLRSMTAVELDDHLTKSLHLLTASSKSAPPRHRTLSATIEWSYDLLTEPERGVLRRCSVFAGGFDLAAASAVCAGGDLQPEHVVDHVDSLVDKSLLVARSDGSTTRFRPLEPVRQWAREALVATGEEDDARRAHARHFADLVDALAPVVHRRGQAAALRRLQVAYPNVRAAFATLVDIRELDSYLDTAFGLFSFWAHHGMHLEGYQTCQRGLGLATDDTDLRRQVTISFVGSLNAGWTRRSVALDIAQQCRDLAGRLADPRAIGWAELALAVVHGNHRFPGFGEDATESAEVQHTRAARELFEAHPGPAWWDPVWERGLQHLVYSSFLPREPARLEEFRIARDAFEEVGDDAWLTILFAQCLSQLDIEDPDTLAGYLRQARDLPVSPWWANVARYRLGVLWQRLGDHSVAIAELEPAVRFAQASGDFSWTREARHLSVSLAELGELREAARLLRSTFDAVGGAFDRRELCRNLTASAYVLELAREDELAARALGATSGVQDQYVDYVATTRERLRARLGATRVAALEAEGAAVDFDQLVGRVRQYLDGVAGDEPDPEVNRAG